MLLLLVFAADGGAFTPTTPDTPDTRNPALRRFSSAKPGTTPEIDATFAAMFSSEIKTYTVFFETDASHHLVLPQETGPFTEERRQNIVENCSVLLQKLQILIPLLEKAGKLRLLAQNFFLRIQEIVDKKTIDSKDTVSWISENSCALGETLYTEYPHHNGRKVL